MPSQQVYGCPIGGTIVREQWATDGSGSTFLWGFLDSEYKCVLLLIDVVFLTDSMLQAARRKFVRGLESCGPHPQTFCNHPACCRREGMSRQQAEDLVATALALAMSRDGSSGGVIRCAADSLLLLLAAAGLLPLLLVVVMVICYAAAAAATALLCYAAAAAEAG